MSSARTLAAGILLGSFIPLSLGLVLRAAPETPEAPESAPHTALAQDPDEAEAMMAAMKKWLDTIDPGPAHELFQRGVGRFETETKVFWAGPDGPPMTTTGTAERRLVLGGRFIEQHTTSTYLIPDLETGQMESRTVYGLGYTGYDRVRNLYIGTWMDSMSTQILAMKGAAHPDGAGITLYGEMDEAMIDVFGRYVKYESRWLDEDTEVFTITDLHAGADYTVVEITFRRVKE